MINEQWRDVVGFEGLYMISNLGRIKRLERKDSLGRFKAEAILKPKKSGKYKGSDNRPRNIEIMVDNIAYRFSMSRLVATAFIGDIKEGCCVVHLNKDCTDDRVENLAIMTYSASLRIDFALKKKPLVCCSSGKDHKMSKKVEAINESGNVIHTFNSLGDCHRAGFDKRTISAACNGKHSTWRPYGYNWRFSEEVGNEA